LNACYLHRSYKGAIGLERLIAFKLLVIIKRCFTLNHTYRVEVGDSIASVFRKSNQTLRTILAIEWKKRDTSLHFSNPEQALILASLIEKETLLPDKYWAKKPPHKVLECLLFASFLQRSHWT
jgi:cell division protein YceG involved in septum cleavage